MDYRCKFKTFRMETQEKILSYAKQGILRSENKSTIHERKTINKLDLIKVKNFCSVKDHAKDMKRQTIDWKKIFASYISNQKHIQNIKITVKTRQKKYPIRKRMKDMKKHFTEGELQMSTMHMKRYLTAIAIRNIQIKTMMRHQYKLTRMDKIKSSENTKY